jgi:3-oxoadipate enol-lactonase
MSELEIDGLAIHYEILGAGEPVVFLNGVMMTAQSWILQTSFFRHRFQCVLHDMRGQLLSGKPDEPWSLETHVEDLRILLDHLEIDRCHLVGTSYGGEVGLIFAFTYPERAKSLTVISSVSHVGPKLDRAVQSWADAALATPEQLYRVALPLNFSSRFIAQNSEVLQQGEDRLRACPPDFFPAFARLVEAFRGVDITDDLPRITCPTLVLVGEKDALKPVSYSRLIAETIPGAEFLIVPNAGHAVVIEKPSEINSVLLGFLEKHR